MPSQSSSGAGWAAAAHTADNSAVVETPTSTLEASGRDRPGLLAALAKPISDAGLLILSAHIDGYGERAVDAFYVVDGLGKKVVEPKAMMALKADLIAALEDDRDQSIVKPRANLQKARASVAR